MTDYTKILKEKKKKSLTTNTVILLVDAPSKVVLYRDDALLTAANRERIIIHVLQC